MHRALLRDGPSRGLDPVASSRDGRWPALPLRYQVSCPARPRNRRSPTPTAKAGVVRLGSVERPPLPAPAGPNDDTGVGPAPPQTVALWVTLVATMGPDELADFDERTFRQWDRASLLDLRRAIERRRREFAG